MGWTVWGWCTSLKNYLQWRMPVGLSRKNTTPGFSICGRWHCRPFASSHIDTMPPKKTKKTLKPLKAPKLSEEFISRVNDAPSWPAVIEVVRQHYGLPNLSTKGGLKECHKNFHTVSKNLMYVWQLQARYRLTDRETCRLHSSTVKDSINQSLTRAYAEVSSEYGGN